MGFLSRKSKQAETTVVEEHPIDQELQEIEEAVPERPISPDQPAARPAGPVTGDDPSSSRDDAAVEESPPAPPAGEEEVASKEEAPTDAASPMAEASEELEPDPDDGRMMASRLDRAESA